ncbi:MAG TPA: hypothetical protein VMX13_01630 [Sedimentisphaerales bacterium]|nr:hypothetical protein [Sedimentisphaerales bacterium]
MRKTVLAILLVLLAGWLLGCDEVPIDIKPQSCPNPVNVKSNGVLPVAILGTDGFDVNDVNTASIRLAAVFSEGILEPIDVAPIAGKFGYSDVSTPVVRVDQADCNCAETGPDGYMDLTVHFYTQDVIAAVEEALQRPLEDGEQLGLGLVADLWDDVLIDEPDIGGYDCIVIRNKGRSNEE